MKKRSQNQKSFIVTLETVTTTDEECALRRKELAKLLNDVMTRLSKEKTNQSGSDSELDLNFIQSANS